MTEIQYIEREIELAQLSMPEDIDYLSQGFWDWVDDAWKNIKDVVGDVIFGWGGDGIIYDRIIEPVKEWLYKKVFKPFAEWIAKQIEAIRAELRIFMHNVKALLAEWLKDDLFFILFVSMVIVIIIKLPEITEWFKGTKIYELGEQLIQKIKLGAVKYIDVFIDLRLIDRILRVFWKDYADVMASWSQAVAGLASDLGEGSGYIHASFSAIRGIYHGYYSVAGFPPEAAELAFYERASEFTKNIDDRFRRYAYDPGLIYSDMMTEVLIPVAEEQRDIEEARVEQIRENYNRGMEIENGLKEIKENITTLIAIQPAVIAEQFELRWGPIEEWLDEAFYRIDTHLIPKVNAVIEAFEERVEYQNLVNEAAAKNAANPRYTLGGYYGLDVVEQQIAQETLAYMGYGDENYTTRAFRSAMTGYSSVIPVFGGLKEIPEIPVLGLELPTARHTGGKPKGDIPSPFVGDY